MWLLVLMSGKWYAVDHVDEDGFRETGVDNLCEHVIGGSIVCVADDLESWCDEMQIDIENVIKVEAE